MLRLKARTMTIREMLQLFALLFFLSTGILSQKQPVPHDDSTATAFLAKLDSTRIADSVYRAELEQELIKLKTTDNLKKQELLDELKTLKEAETKKLEILKKQTDSLKQVNRGFAVAPFGDTIFIVYVKYGLLGAEERSRFNSDRIRQLASDYFFDPDSVKIGKGETDLGILYKEIVILTVTERDALWMGMSKTDLAKLYRSRIIASIMAYKDATSFKTLALKTALALAILFALYLVVRFLNMGFRLYKYKVYSIRKKWFKGIKFKDYELLSANKQIAYFMFISNILRLFLIVLTVYLTLPLVFYLFPWTESISADLIGFVIDPVKKIIGALIRYLPNFFTIIVLAVTFRYILKAIRYLSGEIESENLKIPGFYPDWAKPTYNIMRILVIAFAIIVVFPYLPGSDSPVFQGVSVFLGFLFTLSSAGSLSNIIAGTVLTYMRAFQIGDWVKSGDTLGVIVEKTLLVTRMKTRYNEIITIPNSTLMNSNTVNYSVEARTAGLILRTVVTIGYEVPWRVTHDLLIAAANRTARILKQPKPFVLQLSLENFYPSYELNCFTCDANEQAVIYSELHQNIQDSFHEAGIEILSPHYMAHRDGNTVTIPAGYLPPDYEHPVHTVRIEKKEEKK
ncbi:MAG: mechanosensitive ion channel family protein [Bacteroidetes bacterium]|nr:mechanosensitive ion channel family protein [Bacteroidota bacterium]